MREFYEDLWICRLQTLQPKGLNSEIGSYAKEMYSCYTNILNNKEKLIQGPQKTQEIEIKLT